MEDFIMSITLSPEVRLMLSELVVNETLIWLTGLIR